jgi:hypothetical protein
LRRAVVSAGGTAARRRRVRSTEMFVHLVLEDLRGSAAHATCDQMAVF